MSMPTVREIAQLAGVSKSTVSLVLNNRAGVSDDKRQRVLEARERLIAQNALQQEQATITNEGRPLTVVVLHPPVLRSSYVFSEVLRGIQIAAESYQIHLRLVPNDPNGGEQHVASLYLSDDYLRPHGMIVFGAQQHEPLLDSVYEQGIPCVVLGRNADRYAVSALGRYEDKHAQEATEHLIALGHRAIAFVGGDANYDYVHDRLRGYHEAMAAHQLPTSPDWVQIGLGDAPIQRLLATAPEVTAVMFVNDTCAEVGIPSLVANGWRIPQDVSVVSFDNTTFAQEHAPPLTSVSYRRYEEGQWAVKMLIDQIRHPHIEKVQAIFKADFIVRESCAPPRDVREETLPLT